MSALIVGPSDTPYSGGCFVFDIFFPDNYPNGPPHVWLKTTGNNTFRFNPNLYAEGKVCLSLLGTWSGSEGENWNKDASTLLQVLVSIQSLIFVPDPYFNEPGYESTMHTEDGIRQNREYSFDIREGCIRHAMLHNLRNPVHGFDQIIRDHFFLRKNAILSEVNRWKDEANEHNQTHYRTICGLITELESEFDSLQEPQLNTETEQ